MNSSSRNVGLLAACQGMLYAVITTLVTVNGLAGLKLAPHVSLATLPMTFWVLGGALATMPASFHMKRVGRTRGLSLGALWGFAGALLCALAAWTQSFWLLCLGTMICGVFNAYGQYYRFAAADAAEPGFKAKAVSLVIAGGLVGGILGPNSSRFTVELFEPRFLGAYLGLLVFVTATSLLLRYVQIPTPTAAEQASHGRPLAQIAGQPKFIVAVTAGALSYGVMNFLMTSTPIAMQVCGHTYGAAAFVISSHVLGMFGPSFVTGHLIKRFGTLPIMFVGAALNAGTVAIAVSGDSVTHFWWALVLLGVGWNFLYTGATLLLTETYRPEEKAKAQGVNDQVQFIMMLISSLTSGMTVTQAGWERVNLLALPLVVVIVIALVWFVVHTRPRKAAAA